MRNYATINIVGGIMFLFFKFFFNKRKAQKINARIAKLEKAFTIFQVVKMNDAEMQKMVDVLSNDENYADLVSRYRVCVQKIKRHNDEIKSLFFAYNSVLKQHPISDILKNIEYYSWDRLLELQSTVQRVYLYVIPDKFKPKQQYDQYKNDLQDIIEHYEIIKEQKKLLNSIDEESLPDEYIDAESAEIILTKAKTLMAKYKTYAKRYYPAPILNNKVIEKHNEQFIARHLQDTIFDNVNGKSLDQEQRRAVLCNAKSNLTIAGAGSGKTLTICGKVKYLLETGLASRDDILLLSYSHASADDLAKKVDGVAKGLRVATFHALGLNILTEASGKKKAVEDQLKSYITKFFDEELVNNPKIANEVFQFISLYFYAPYTKSKKYKNEGELFQDLKNTDFRTLKDRLGKLSADKYRHETLKNEYVKSNEELVIANFLFTNGIEYEYEKPYEVDTSTPEKRQYTPDFYLPEYKIYLEHYGIDRSGNASQYEKEASEAYVESMQWKRQTHRENQTTCIETYSYEFFEGTIFDNLKAHLIEHGVELKPLPQKEVADALHNAYSGRDFSSLFNLIMTFISLYKAQIKDDSGFDKFKQQLNEPHYGTSRTRLFLDICKNIYNFYMENLRAANKIDFDDMILQAIDLLDKSPNFKYKYIIVDEFQDISQSRTRFLRKLIEHGNAKLFAVGDDWQAIYRFAGCDINVFLEFETIFPNAKLNYITSTHRNSTELQAIVEPFITANPNQYKKHIRSAKHQEKPVRIIYHKGNKAMALTKALNDISKLNKTANVLILGRNRRDIDSYICREIEVVDYKRVSHKDYPKMQLQYSTVHGSKGLESDFVVLISGEDANNGFPNKAEDDSVLDLLLGKKNAYKYAEERRLFYVALTRTKSIVYLLSDKERSSQFIHEIKNKCFIMRDERGQKEEIEYLCPWCKSGHLVIRENRGVKKLFYGCSNYPYCCYTNDDVKSVYFNNRCPECGDFLVERKGDGIFFGCHNYPRCKHMQTIEESRRRIGFREG